MARWRQPWYQGTPSPSASVRGYWSATPIQLAKAISILTQNGHDVTPHLLKSTASSGRRGQRPHQPERGHRHQERHLLAGGQRDGMWRVINGHEGTGRRAFANTPKAAGKSGTAQVVGLKENQVYNAATTKMEHRDNALFVAFAP